MNNKTIDKLDFDTIEHEKVPFILVHRTVIQNITDHFAGFIWVYLHSLPSDWNINKSHLQKHFDIGEDKLKKHLAYLNKTKLIEYRRNRAKDGTLSRVTIRVLNGTDFDPNAIDTTGVKTTPLDLTTGVKNHPVADHTSGFYPPLTEKIVITDNNNDTNNNISTIKSVVPIEYPETYYPQTQETKSKSKKMTLNELKFNNPHNIPTQMIDDWMTARKEKRAPITATVWNRLTKELAKCTDPISAFEEMVAAGWQSFKAEWIKSKHGAPTTSFFDHDSIEWGKQMEKEEALF